MIDGPTSIAARLCCEWRMKLWLGALLSVVFCTGYFAIQRLPVRPVTMFEPTWIDRAIKFSPAWVWAYQSIYLLFPTAWLARTRSDLRRYAAGFLLLSLTGFAFFVAWPVAGPRPADVPQDGMFGVIVAYDRVLNSFPSLHMALATYACCFAISMLDRGARAWRRIAVVVAVVWVALIGYSTIATKQHYAVDVPAGVLLGWLAHVAVMDRGRLPRPAVPRPTTATPATATAAAPDGGLQ